MLDLEGNVWKYRNENPRKYPRIVQGLPPIKAICTGKRHYMYLDKDGNVWRNGYNRHGAMGSKPQEEGQEEGEELYDSIKRPEKFESLPPVIQVSTGKSHTLFLDVDGNVWGCGTETHWQLGTMQKGERY